jgi:hypothetical protein
VINDLLDPTGQNLRVREDAQVSHLSFLKKVVISIHDFAEYYKLVSYEYYFFREPMLRV